MFYVWVGVGSEGKIKLTFNLFSKKVYFKQTQQAEVFKVSSLSWNNPMKVLNYDYLINKNDRFNVVVKTCE